eukprot:TRINITY_DN4859_c1_g1_i4.p1 TRINITY_DN4859_c1_g1~~TRINITY_DN4859_c1_g1_i4.p1  ORF type:complete len:457 (-),score=80.27 TRINITY_DN4859_c1_g1_i4:107-1477(-)
MEDRSVVKDRIEADEHSRVAALCDWLRIHGVVLCTDASTNTPRIRISFISPAQGYGVLATTDLNVGDCVCRIPKSCVLSRRNSSVAAILERESLWKCKRSSLIVAALHERSLKEKSKWHGYFQILSEYEDLPALWTGPDKALLEGTEFAAQIEEDAEKIVSKYQRLVIPLLDKYPDIFDRSFITLERFVQMSTLVASRAFQVDQYHGDSFVPLADMFNHISNESVHIEGDSQSSVKATKKRKVRSSDDASNGHTSGRDEEYLDMILVRSVMKDEQIFNTFGQLDNYHLAYQYGFVEPDNPHRCLSIHSSEIMQYAEQVKQKSHIKSAIRLFKTIFELDEEYIIKPEGDLNGSFLSLLRVVFSSPEELKKWSADPDKLIRHLKAASEKSILAGKEIRDCLVHILNQRKLSIENCPALRDNDEQGAGSYKRTMVRTVLQDRLFVIRALQIRFSDKDES